MKRAISAINCNLDKVPAPLFYKCRMFCIYNDENERIDYYENPYYDMPEGYESQLVNWLINLGVNHVYSLRYRPEVIEELKKAGIEISTLETQETTIEAIISKFAQTT